MERAHNESAAVSRRKIRALVRAEVAPATLTSLPHSMSLSPGRLEISFEKVEQLAEAMLMGEEFAEPCDIHPCGK